jgi:hypothetical protein
MQIVEMSALAHGCESLHTAWAELQNRRLQVRFLSHLPEKPEFMGVADLWPSIIDAL